MEYKTTNVTVDPSFNKKVLNSAIAGFFTPLVIGTLGRHPLRGLLTGAVTALIVLYTGWATEPKPGDGVLTIYDPEPPDWLDAEEALHG